MNKQRTIDLIASFSPSDILIINSKMSGNFLFLTETWLVAAHHCWWLWSWKPLLINVCCAVDDVGVLESSKLLCW